MSGDRLTVVLAHNRYRERGGEDAAFEAEAAALARAGLTVVPVVAPAPEDGGVRARLGLAAAAMWSRRWHDEIVATVRRCGADLVHVHNFWPGLSPAALWGARAAGAATVMTLHNYRLVCPAGTLLRAGAPCELCVGRTFAWPGIVHGCYRGSRAASAALAGAIGGHRLRGTWRRGVDRYIAPSAFARDIFVRGGLPAERIAVKPNFAPDPGPPDPDRARRGALYVGRLSAEKGIDVLLGAWPGIAAPLTVIGAGDRARLGLGRTPACVSFAGALPSAEVAAAMAGAAVLVFPSICYENCPLVVLEALSHGLPVIASRLGAVPELIEDGVTGLLFRAGDAGDLAAKVRWALAHGDELQRMGANAYAAYRRRFRPEPNVAALCAIYEAAMRARRAGR